MNHSAIRSPPSFVCEDADRLDVTISSPAEPINDYAPMRDRLATFFNAAQNVCFWHKADIATRSTNVRFRG